MKTPFSKKIKKLVEISLFHNLRPGDRIIWHFSKHLYADPDREGSGYGIRHHATVVETDLDGVVLNRAMSSPRDYRLWSEIVVEDVNPKDEYGWLHTK
ncbi:MAG: hypothetical protein KCHDKBKB_00690 [Elusimicrobia bacterium]|nr:hypothetical protein [Elusimicrobiota bacterium]